MTDNIQVAIRVRPILKFQDEECWIVNTKSGSITSMITSKVAGKFSLDRNSTKMNIEDRLDKFSFDFDFVADETYRSQAIFKEQCSKVVSSALKGINGTICAYGQTCSGKTYTMLGQPQHPGIIPCCFRQIFKQISADTNWQYCVQMSYIEIYNEQLTDLFQQGTLKMQQDIVWGIEIKGATKVRIRSFAHAVELLQKGQSNRSYRKKDNHERSSRSHTIMRLYITSNNMEMSKQKLIKRHSLLNLVDLAGSQRLTDSKHDNVTQTGSINKSLFLLSNVISKLAENHQHIPYRDSKLTRLLENSLGGNSQTLIICCISPALMNFQQSLSTLRFGMRARKVVNIKIENREEGEVSRLQRLLEQQTKQYQQLQRKYEQLQEKYSQLERKYHQQNKENQRTIENRQVKLQKELQQGSRSKSPKLSKPSKEVLQPRDASRQSLRQTVKQKHMNMPCVRNKQNKTFKMVMWGSNKDGRLGHANPLSTNMHEIEQFEFIKMALGPHHTMAITQSGQLYGWGKNTSSQINNSHEAIVSPHKIEFKKQIIEIAAGWGHTIAVDLEGRAYSWGDNTNGQLGIGNHQNMVAPTLIPDINTVRPYCGHSHSALLDINNDLHTFGCNIDCRLMMPNEEDKDSCSPVRIGLRGVVKASLGINHTCVITKEGKLFAGGDGTFGQLGRFLSENVVGAVFSCPVSRKFQDDKVQRYCPIVEIEYFDETRRPVDVACGENMTVVLDQNQKVYSFGKGAYHRLGLNTHQNVYEPTEIKELRNIVKIAAGCRHAMCLSDDGNLYSWGFNLYQQTGLRSESDLKTPQRVEKLKKQVCDISCGYFHSACFIDREKSVDINIDL